MRKQRDDILRGADNSSATRCQCTEAKKSHGNLIESLQGSLKMQLNSVDVSNRQEKAALHKNTSARKIRLKVLGQICEFHHMAENGFLTDAVMGISADNGKTGQLLKKEEIKCLIKRISKDLSQMRIGPESNGNFLNSTRKLSCVLNDIIAIKMGNFNTSLDD